jgi:replication initiation protein RepC
MQHSSIATFRKLNSAVITSQQRAKDGLAQSVNKAELAITLKKASPVLKVSGTPYQVLDILLGLVRKEDLKAGRRPLVAISNERLAEYICRCKRTVTRAIRTLVEAGLIAYNDSPNGRRFIRRKDDGSIDYGYGLDLTPACNRLEELKKVAKEFQDALAAKKAAQRAITKYTRAIADLAAIYPELASSSLSRAAYIKGQCLSSGEKASLLENLHEEILDRIGNMSFEGDKNDVHLSNTTRKTSKVPVIERGQYLYERASGQPDDTSYATEIASEKKCIAKSMDCKPRRTHANGSQQSISIGLLQQACLEVQNLVETKFYCWQDLIGSLAPLAHLIGLHEVGLKAAIASQGRFVTAATLAVVAEKSLRYPELITSPSGYFLACIERANAGNLNLSKSVFGLLSATK